MLVQCHTCNSNAMLDNNMAIKDKENNALLYKATETKIQRNNTVTYSYQGFDWMSGHTKWKIFYTKSPKFLTNNLLGGIMGCDGRS